MTCDQLDFLPFPACATILTLPEVIHVPTAPPHQARLRNLATDRRERTIATVDPSGTVTVILTTPLVAGHEYLLEILDLPDDAPHELASCGHSSTYARLRPVQEFDGDGQPITATTVTLQCAS